MRFSARPRVIHGTEAIVLLRHNAAIAVTIGFVVGFFVGFSVGFSVAFGFAVGSMGSIRSSCNFGMLSKGVQVEMALEIRRIESKLVYRYDNVHNSSGSEENSRCLVAVQDRHPVIFDQ